MRTSLLALTLLAGTTASMPARADMVAALVGDDTLAHVDTAAKKVVKTVKVTGISGRLLGIDVRPSDGMLYGLAADGAIVTIDPQTGTATAKSKLDTMLAAGVTASVDFNPVADRMRIIGSDGTNLRANVDDGKVTKDGQLKFAETDGMKGKTPKVVAGAYTNSMKGAKETALFDIDSTGAFLKQAPPNDGVLSTLGQMGMASDTVAFDIVSDGQGGNSAFAMAGAKLYSVDLATGKATEAATIAGVDGAVRDIAILPKM